MKKMTAGIGISLIALAGCSNEETTSDATQDVQQAEEVSDTANAETAETTEVEEEKSMMVEETIMSKHNVVLYENEVGSVEFSGYRQTSDGYIEFALKMNGDLKYADDAVAAFRLISRDGNIYGLDQGNKQGIRITKNGEYHIYRSHETMSDPELIRVGVSLIGDVGVSEEENTLVEVDLPPQEETQIIPGIEAYSNEKTFDTIVRENEKIKISFSHFDTSAMADQDMVDLSGIIEFKEDIEEPFYFTYAQGDMWQTDTKELNMSAESAGSTYFRGVTATFEEVVDLGMDVGIESAETLSFGINGQLFVLDLVKREEANQADLTTFDQPAGFGLGMLETKTWEGFIDPKGVRVYNALKINRPFDDFGGGTDRFSEVIYPVGGYKTLKFKVGAAKNESISSSPYEVRVYGAGFENSEGMEKPAGDILFQKEITKDTPLEEVEVDISGVENAVIFIDSNIDAGSENPDARYIPIILSDVTVEK